MEDSSTVPLKGDLIPKKPRHLKLGFDRPLSKPKFVILSLLTYPVLVTFYKSIVKFASILISFYEDKFQHESSLKELEMMRAESELDPNNFGYTGDVFLRELAFIHKYALQIKNARIGDTSESPILYAKLLADLDSVLSSGEIATVFNFGIGFAHVDTLLAIRFPKVKFVGIERTPVASWYNKEFSAAQPANLQIIDGDIIEHLAENRYENGLLLHIRTATLLPTSLVKSLYSHAYLSGFTHIYGAEQCGFSRRTGEPFNFTYTNQPSELYRRHMFIHNYPGLLLEARYKVPELQFLKTRHAHFDYRIVTFLATKQN